MSDKWEDSDEYKDYNNWLAQKRGTYRYWENGVLKASSVQRWDEREDVTLSHRNNRARWEIHKKEQLWEG